MENNFNDQVQKLLEKNFGSNKIDKKIILKINNFKKKTFENISLIKKKYNDDFLSPEIKSKKINNLIKSEINKQLKNIKLYLLLLVNYKIKDYKDVIIDDKESPKVEIKKKNRKTLLINL